MTNRIPTPEPRIAAFENFGFGLFIHYGLYSLMEMGEKPMFFYRIPGEEYRELMKKFTAEQLDFRAVAATARETGMKYAVLTARHHDGFSLFDTKGLNDYDAPHAAAGRDLVREFTEGCRAEGIVPFLYHTTLDWYDPRFRNDFPAYLAYLKDSVEILCRNYGEIGGFWFDGNWSLPEADWKEEELYSMIRRYQPQAILVNNSGMAARGAVGADMLDSVTFENGRPEPMDRRGMPKYLAAEMCETMSDYWGYAKEDCHYKSSSTLIESLCSCRKVGANYLLNVGPMGNGEIPFAQKALLSEIACWRKATDAPLYGAKPCGIAGNDRDFGLREGNRLFLFVFGLTRADSNGQGNGSGNGIRIFRGLPGKVKKITWTDNGEALSFTQNGGTLSVDCTGFPYGKSLIVRIACCNL